MANNLKLIIVTASSAFLLIYGIGFIWAIPALVLFSGHFENFQAITVEGYLIQQISFLISFLVAYAIAARHGYHKANSLSARKKIHLSTEAFLVVAFCVVAAYLFPVAVSLITIERFAEKGLAAILYSILVAGVVGNLIIALGEEMVYRGLLFTYLWKRTGNLHFSAISSSVVFAFMHLHYSSPISYMLAFAFGCLLAYAYHRSRTLFVPVAMHFSYNLFMDILKPDERILSGIMEADIVQIAGLGDVFAVMRLIMLLLIVTYIIKRFSIKRQGKEATVV